jgi:hypothetical protein
LSPASSAAILRTSVVLPTPGKPATRMLFMTVDS